MKEFFRLIWSYWSRNIRYCDEVYFVTSFCWNRFLFLKSNQSLGNDFFSIFNLFGVWYLIRVDLFERDLYDLLLFLRFELKVLMSWNFLSFICQLSYFNRNKKVGTGWSHGYNLNQKCFEVLMKSCHVWTIFLILKRLKSNFDLKRF